MLLLQRITADSLRALALFAGLPAPSLQQLLGAGRVRYLSPRETLSASTSEESYCFVVEGVIAITLGGSSAGTNQQDLDYLGYFEPGHCFSVGFLQVPGPASIGCVSLGRSALLEVETSALGGFLSAHPDWHRTLVDSLGSARTRFLSLLDPTRHVVQDFLLREGFVNSSRVRVGRLDSCIDCGKCQAACAARFGGVARMVRGGPELGCLTFPVVCQTCRDKPCLAVCSFGGLVHDDQTGTIRISERCGGCGACVEACPYHAIRMVEAPYTVADFPDPIPNSNLSGMTNVPNLFVAGDVAGSALIRQAINDAVRAVDAISPRPASTAPNTLDVVIVGAGPAGLSAALRARERGLLVSVLEKDQLGSTIRDYPKNKHVMAEPHHVPLLGSLWFDACTKEELLARWQQTAQRAGLDIRCNAEVERIEAQGDDFIVHFGGEWVAARAVIVGVGKRGSPRRLQVPGEIPGRVLYNLTDADEFAGRDVLVVGGGDSALEAALSLAEAPDCRVTLSYRRDAFTRAKSLNRSRLMAYQKEGRIKVELQSTVLALEPRTVRLRTPRGEISLPNDVVFALLGSDPPTDFLKRAAIQVLKPGSAEMATYASGRGTRQRAVKCDHCAEFDDQACLTACPTHALFETTPAALFESTGENAFLRGTTPGHAKPWWHLALTILVFVLLAGTGVEAFLLATQPEHSFSAWVLRGMGSTLEVSYSSGRGFGHWLGYLGAGGMLASVAYSLRTRVRRFANLGAQSTWLSAHLWLGFVGATLVTYHSALKLDRWASIAVVLMWVVVTTGILGRYVRGRTDAAVNLVDFERRASAPRSLLGLERGILASTRWLLRHWNIVHIVLAIAMFILAGIHIVYGFLYKAV